MKKNARPIQARALLVRSGIKAGKKEELEK